MFLIKYNVILISETFKSDFYLTESAKIIIKKFKGGSHQILNYLDVISKMSEIFA